EHKGHLAIATNDPVRALLGIDLFGTGVAGSLQVTPESLDFEERLEGSYYVKSVQVENVGPGRAGVTHVRMQGSGAAPFRATTECPTLMDVGETCDVNVQFSASTGSLFNATLSISQVAGSPLLVPVAGQGPRAQLELSATQMDLGGTDVNKVSAEFPLVVTNRGLGRLVLSEIEVSGPFAVRSTCTDSLRQDQSCTLWLQHQPLSEGRH